MQNREKIIRGLIMVFFFLACLSTLAAIDERIRDNFDESTFFEFIALIFCGLIGVLSLFSKEI